MLLKCLLNPQIRTQLFLLVGGNINDVSKPQMSKTHVYTWHFFKTETAKITIDFLSLEPCVKI